MSDRFERKQARQTIISALRIIRDLQLTCEVLFALARIYRDVAYWDSYCWTSYAARQLREEERGGGN